MRVVPSRRPSVRLVALALLSALPACTLEPAGMEREQRSHALAGDAFHAPRGERVHAPLPAEPTVDEFEAHALLARADVEAAWHAWQAALQDVLVASGWPNSDLAVGLTSMLANGSLWDTSAVMIGFDPMRMLLLPAKVRQAGRAAFQRALAAGCAFEQMRLDVRSSVREAAAEWALLGTRIALAEEEVALLSAIERSEQAGVQGGASLDGLLGAGIALAEARMALDALRADVPGRRATLNARLGRRHDAPLALPTSQPAPRPLDADALWRLQSGVILNPRLQGRWHETLALAEQTERERQQAWPNVAPNVTVSGGGPESVGAMITIPTTVPAVRAAVRGAQALHAAAEASLHQERLDDQAQFAATLAALRGDERILQRLADDVEPAVRALVAMRHAGYTHGTRPLAELIEAQRLHIEVRGTRATTLAARERRLAALESLGGIDLGRQEVP